MVGAFDGSSFPVVERMHEFSRLGHAPGHEGEWTSVHTSVPASVFLSVCFFSPSFGRSPVFPSSVRKGDYCAQAVRGDIPVTPKILLAKNLPHDTAVSGQIIPGRMARAAAHAVGGPCGSQRHDIAFCLEWQDNTKNDRLTPGTFRDGVALGCRSAMLRHFLHGSLDHYINIWHWKADWQSDIDRRAARTTEKDKAVSGEPRRFEVIPRRASSVEDLIGGGFSTLTTKEKQGRVQGKATWKDGMWRVVMRRPLSSEEQENEAKLIPGRIQAVSFAVWNGENKERNGKKASTLWFQLSLDPVTKRSCCVVG